jgi:hypothetical protein
MQLNSFDEGSDNFVVRLMIKSNTAFRRFSLMFRRAGGWFMAKRTALCVWTTANETGPILPKSLRDRLAEHPPVDIQIDAGSRPNSIAAYLP